MPLAGSLAAAALAFLVPGWRLRAGGAGVRARAGA
jgi:hypothetical protein